MSGLGSKAAAAPIRVVEEPLGWGRFGGHQEGLAGKAASDRGCGLLTAGGK